MASNTIKVILPRSRSSASTSASATIVSDEAAGRTTAETEPEGADSSDFVHPDHVIPNLDYSKFEDLIIVCCHAIYLPDADSSDFPLHSPLLESNWLLAPFQKSDPKTGKPGEHTTFVAHAQAGLRDLIIRPDAVHLEKNLLIFSGGSTKRSITPLSEARSYYHAALAHELAEGNYGGGRTHDLYRKGRILLEEHSTDSFQNLLLSILLFRRTTGHYPKTIRVITHAFKSRRFLELHARAIRWPKDSIQVQGIDPIMSGSDLHSTLLGEAESGYASWKEDLFGIGNTLGGKRKQRGWDESVVEELVEGLEDSVKGLLRGNTASKLPWEPDEVTKS